MKVLLNPPCFLPESEIPDSDFKHLNQSIQKSQQKKHEKEYYIIIE